MRMFNPDGTEDMCGNGLRCVGLWASRHGWLHGGRFTVLTKEGPRAVRLIESADDHSSGLLGVDMGKPRFEPAEIPMAAGIDGAVCGFPLTAGDRVFPIVAVNTGSTHTVIFGPQPSEADFQRYSPMIEDHPFFPERTSVLWSTVVDEARDVNQPVKIRTRIWERGAGETLGCGTGACAVAVAAQAAGLSAPRQDVEVISRGGTLAISWAGGESSVDMVGPAVLVFEGDLKLG
jgi:diaminopimelate epimerase